MTAPVPSHASMPLAEVERQLDQALDVAQRNALRALTALDELEVVALETAQIRAKAAITKLAGVRSSEVPKPCPHGWDPKDCSMCGGER